MPNVYLTTRGLRAELSADQLKVVPGFYESEKERREQTRKIPLHDVESVVVSTGCQLTTPALIRCCQEKIPVIFLSHTGKVIGSVHSPVLNPASRIQQYQRADDRLFHLEIACRIVVAKIRNSRRVLQRLQANAADRDAARAIDQLKYLGAQAAHAGNMDRLRGLEGSAAASYFEAYGQFYGEAMPFEHRSRRPPHNPPNAVLSYAYALLTGECIQMIWSSGMEPSLGSLHEVDGQRPSLALDLIEPFRAPVADTLALDLFSHGSLDPDRDFKQVENGIYLRSSAKKRLFTAYERRMERDFTHPVRKERTQLRRELRNQVYAYKSALMEQNPFNPYQIIPAGHGESVS